MPAREVVAIALPNLSLSFRARARERAALAGQPRSCKPCTRGVETLPQPPAAAPTMALCMDAARALLETAISTRNLMLTSRKVHKES